MEYPSAKGGRSAQLLVQLLRIAMEVEYGDITSEEALAFSLPDPTKAREDTLALLQVSYHTAYRHLYEY